MNAASAIDVVATALRREILDGKREPGSRLIERELIEANGVARHTLRAALRALAAEGLVALTPNAGARVAALKAAQAEGLFELRTALEAEACRLALARDPDALYTALGLAATRLREVCESTDPAWSDVAEAHAGVHRSIVQSARSERLALAYASLDGEMRLFVGALRPAWSLERMADHHDALAGEVEIDGPGALRRHLADGLATILGRS